MPVTDVGVTERDSAPAQKPKLQHLTMVATN
ncbi:uncharacterized protein G2W53_035128 [Senna tora]|uniref:Uncharacterized protein n=1 Tax=Senna tora TaxID=362788 RepID=A0A834W3U4_9FABA|nr:uncharacterized protein G2W53_035128 [Senna tora]